MTSPNIKTASNFTAKVLNQSQLTSTSPTAIYTVPANTSTKVTAFTLTNTTVQAVTVSIHLTPTGISSVASDYVVIASYSLAAKDTMTVTELIGGFYVDGAKIWATPSTGFAVSVSLHGLEIS